MLILTRKTGEAVRIGNVRIVINRVGRGAVRIGIEAPREVPIVREELDENSGGGVAIAPSQSGIPSWIPGRLFQSRPHRRRARHRDRIERKTPVADYQQDRHETRRRELPESTGSSRSIVPVVVILIRDPDSGS